MLDTCINVKIKLKKIEISFFSHYIKAKVAIAGPLTPKIFQENIAKLILKNLSN